jgi:hypothetical protein
MTRPRDEELEELLAEYIDGTLDDSGRRRVELLLDADPTLKRRTQAMLADAKLLRSAPREGVEYDLSEGFEVQAERDMLLGDAPRPTSAGRRFRIPPAAIAAMLLLGVGLAWVSIQVAWPDPVLTDSVPLAATDATPASSKAIAEEQSPLPSVARSGVFRKESDELSLGAEVVPTPDIVAPLPADEWLAIERLRAGGDPPARPVVAAVIESASPVVSRMLVGSYFIDAGVSATLIPAPHPHAQTLQLLDQLGRPTESGRMIAQMDQLQTQTFYADEPLGLLIRGIGASQFGDLVTRLTRQSSPMDVRRQVVSQSMSMPSQTIDPESQIDAVVIIRPVRPPP